MVDTLTKIGLQAQAQMIGLQYLGYQVSEWLIEAAAKVFVAMAFLVWMLASLEVMFFLPVIVLVLPAWLFDRTRAWGERSVGFILGLILTGALVLMVAGVFIKQETQLMEQFANTATSPSGNASSLGRTAWFRWGEQPDHRAVSRRRRQPSMAPARSRR